MSEKFYCVVDARGYFKNYVYTRADESGQEVVQHYQMLEGERLIDAAPPTKRQHAGSTGFATPRWDEDATAWVEGATGEDLAAWESEHPDPVSLEDKRAAKHAEVSAASEAAIYAGMDVETTQGTEHFSLTEKDQINLTTAKNAVDKGAAAYPYHADDARCRIFTADEINAISQASIAHIIYHTTYCNHLFEWIRRADAAELAGITYGSELPDDLAAHMQEILTQAGAVAETEAVT
ncbi:hypothetical protein [uncultured Agathobaculum sp.]|uniref:DUF4376 domain-containing protein n=1 Tax=uncultured Agathobaculum sp. TaxID=2048140 RepID=UPI003209FFA5